METINKILSKRSKLKKYTLGVQNITPPVLPENSGAKDAVNIGTGVATGLATGGPIGGLIGLATSIIGNKANKKAAQVEYQSQLQNYRTNQTDYLKDQVLSPDQLTQQLNQYAQGTPSIGQQKEIEVEKDELVFQKTATGKYVLKADFKDGRTHNKGGEGYVAQKGDIIFPGKDRKKVLQAYTNQDYPKLESMRVSLPKDVDDKAQGGLDGTDPADSTKAKTIDFASEIWAPYMRYINRNRQAIRTLFQPETSAIGTPELNNLLRPGEKLPLSRPPNINSSSGPLSADQISAFTAPFNRTTSQGYPITKTGGVPKTVDPRIASRERTAIPVQGVGREGLGLNSTNTRYDVVTPSKYTPTNIGSNNQGDGNKENGSNIPWGEIAQFGSAITNMFPGKSEVQKTPNINLAKLQYKDTSGHLRNLIEGNTRVARSNARNASAGNIQNYLANQRMAGLQGIEQQAGVDAQEYNKQLNIANQNTGIINRERMINSQHGQQDTQVNAQNRAARRESINTGIGQVGELAGQFAQDKQTAENQAKLMKTLESMGLFTRLPDGSLVINQAKTTKE